MDYKKSVFLPQTSFSMKANLAQKEPNYVTFWDQIDLYQKQRAQSSGKKPFILHFGPPYANGHIHIGHALSEILKDIINKTYQMMGYDAPMVPGWDCHGLPIEWKIEEQYRAQGKNKDEVGIIQFREECRQFARKWLNIQREEFKRLGIVADWKNPYVTMDFETEGSIVECLGKFLLDGSLYRGVKPVLWSVVEKTALAEAEVEYKTKTSDSVYVTFPIVQTQDADLKDASVVIWTTTPWTIPANRAVAYHSDALYLLVSYNGKKLLIAKELKEALEQKWNCTLEELKTIKGTELKGMTCQHPLGMSHNDYAFEVPLLHGEHVTMDAGTGFVHTAPSHGLEDFQLGKEYNLEIPELVLGDGLYADHVALFAGVHVFKVNPMVINHLKESGRLVFHETFEHQYPHSWRSKAPLIYRVTGQWFISMSETNLREKALKAIDNVGWYPKQGHSRIKAMVEQRPDWCISRQRSWGTPIAIFVNKKNGEPLRDAAVHQKVVDILKKEGADAWYIRPASDFLGNNYSEQDYEKVLDVLDVWFDSGCSHQYVLNGRADQKWPADLYLEGSDQHRGWFQVSLLVGCELYDTSPYKNVLTHGFVLDDKGYKMSKSQGNVVAPEAVLSKHGADLLRLWVVSSNYQDDVRINPNLPLQTDWYRRFRNTLRYVLGALDGYDSQTETVSYSELPSLEKFVLHRIGELDELLQESAKNFDLLEFYEQLHYFCTNDLSAFYFDIRKDVLYCDGQDSLKRRSTRYAMHTIASYLIHWVAPVLSFTAEEAWQALTKDETSSIHLQEFLRAQKDWNQPDIKAMWEEIRQIRRVINGALELARNDKKIGSSLQAHVVLSLTQDHYDRLKDLDWAGISIVSKVDIVKQTDEKTLSEVFTLNDVSHVCVQVNVATGEKCQRCWQVLEEVGNQNDPNLCERCDQVVASQTH